MLIYNKILILTNEENMKELLQVEGIFNQFYLCIDHWYPDYHFDTLIYNYNNYTPNKIEMNCTENIDPSILSMYYPSKLKLSGFTYTHPLSIDNRVANKPTIILLIQILNFKIGKSLN